MRDFTVQMTEEQFAALKDDLRDWTIGDNPSDADVFEACLPFEIDGVEETTDISRQRIGGRILG